MLDTPEILQDGLTDETECVIVAVTLRPLLVAVLRRLLRLLVVRIVRRHRTRPAVLVWYSVEPHREVRDHVNDRLRQRSTGREGFGLRHALPPPASSVTVPAVAPDVTDAAGANRSGNEDALLRSSLAITCDVAAVFIWRLAVITALATVIIFRAIKVGVTATVRIRFLPPRFGESLEVAYAADQLRHVQLTKSRSFLLEIDDGRWRELQVQPCQLLADLLPGVFGDGELLVEDRLDVTLASQCLHAVAEAGDVLVAVEVVT